MVLLWKGVSPYQEHVPPHKHTTITLSKNKCLLFHDLPWLLHPTATPPFQILRTRGGGKQNEVEIECNWVVRCTLLTTLPDNAMACHLKQNCSNPETSKQANTFTWMHLANQNRRPLLFPSQREAAAILSTYQNRILGPFKADPSPSMINGCIAS